MEDGGEFDTQPPKPLCQSSASLPFAQNILPVQVLGITSKLYNMKNRLQLTFHSFIVAYDHFCNFL